MQNEARRFTDLPLAYTIHNHRMQLQMIFTFRGNFAHDILTGLW